MENNILDKKIISAKEASEISKNNTWADSVLESSIMPQIKMAAKKGIKTINFDFGNPGFNSDKETIEKIKSTLENLGYKIKQDYKTLTIGW